MISLLCAIRNSAAGRGTEQNGGGTNGQMLAKDTKCRRSADLIHHKMIIASIRGIVYLAIC